MQTCSRCNTLSPDSVSVCPTCQADLREFSLTAQSLRRFRANPRVNLINLASSEDACPVCRAAQGTYSKESAPDLPLEGCSCTNGCTCFYQPLLEEIYP